MNRIIKFRNWDARIKQWIAKSFPPSLYKAVNVVSCQYTGIKDANGVEIYEGDYIYYGSGSNYETLAFEVVWSPAKLGWVFRHDEFTYLDDEWTPSGSRFESLYVIGNRFEGVKSVEE